MSKTLTVEGDINAVNTKTNLTGQGSVAAPSRVTPANASKIVGVVAAVTCDQAAEGAAAFIIRLGGNAIRRGEQVIVFAGLAANTVVSGSDLPPVYNPLFKLFDADIEIDPSEVIDISMEMAGDDLGDATAVVTLIFE